jgi:Flp pilus assembly protein TadD
MIPAAAQFHEAIKLNPKHALAHRSLGLVLGESGDFLAAASELRMAVAQFPDDPEGHHLLGTVLIKANDFSSAAEQFHKAISLRPNLAEAHSTLAQALQKRGRKDEARKKMEELERINLEQANAGRAMILVETAEGIERGVNSSPPSTGCRKPSSSIRTLPKLIISSACLCANPPGQARVRSPPMA